MRRIATCLRPTYRDCRLFCCALQTIMKSQWGACNPDILQHCFDAQLDHNDNAAAACVNRLWRVTFCCGGHAIDLVYSLLRWRPNVSYLHQFSQLTSVTLRRPGTWRSPESQLTHECCRKVAKPVNLSNIPPACLMLTLDHCLPTAAAGVRVGNTLSQSVSQLSNLRQLNVQDVFGARVAIGELSHQTNLEVLQVTGGAPHRFHLFGCLRNFPCTITRLQLSGCTVGKQPSCLNIEDLTHLQSLKDLDLTDSAADFGTASKSGGLSMLTRLVLKHTITNMRLHDDILPLTALRVLNLHHQPLLCFGAPTVVVSLGELLCHLSCLQELNVIGYPALHISPADCKVLKLSSFCFEYSQLDNPDKSRFERFLVPASAHANVNRPFLRMDGNFASCGIDWVFQLPFQALAHLTIHKAQEWPSVVFDLLDSGVQHLRVLDIRFDDWLQTSSTPISLDSKMNLTDLYIAGTSSPSYDFAQCTTLCSVNIIHKASFIPVVSLPPFLTSLCLHNILSASKGPELHTLDDIVNVKLGIRVTSTDAIWQLPRLPISVLELDLWDCSFTDLRQLTRLTNLKKLSMPDAPTEQQLHTIRQLRQLRWLNVTGRQGMS